MEKVLLLSTPKKVPVKCEMSFFRGKFFLYVQKMVIAFGSDKVSLRHSPTNIPERNLVYMYQTGVETIIVQDRDVTVRHGTCLQTARYCHDVGKRV